MEEKLEKISLLIGKNVISIYEGENLGIIQNVVFDDKFNKIILLELFDEQSEKEFVIETKYIFSVNDVVIIKNKDCLIEKNNIDIKSKNPTNFGVYDIEGKYIGKITDIKLDEKFNTSCFELNNGKTFTQHELLNVGKNVAILQPAKKNKISDFKSKPKFLTNNKKNTMVTIEATNRITSPKKVLTDNYSFLIGRKLDKNIYSENKQLIAKKHSTITPQIIDIASQNGKLKELTNSSLT